ncbi:MAG TPA: HTH domain-containing protein [Polyangiaceae bacterium]|nr:HTH domain-containing protein [Polyangiaceae bacterium]HYQ46157.1 HTH domain-containing protein [Polyangiaceae bacterium]
MTFTEAAAQVLRLVGKPLHYKEITDVAIEKNLLSHVGKSPEVTMGARLAALVKKGDKENPLVRIKPGVFALREWDPAMIEKGLADRTPALERLAAQGYSGEPEVDTAEDAPADAASSPHAAHVTFDDEDGAAAPDEGERSRAEFAAHATELFASEDDDDEPIFGGAADAAAQTEAAPTAASDSSRRRRRRRGRGRPGEERGGDDLPSYTVSDAPAVLPAELTQEIEARGAAEPRPERVRPREQERTNDRDRGAERERGDRGSRRDERRDERAAARVERSAEREGPIDELVGKDLADAVESMLLGFDRSRGPVAAATLIEAAQRRGRLVGDQAASQGLLLAAARTDNLRSVARGHRPRFRISANRIGLTEWQLDAELARLERDLLQTAERYREVSRRAFARSLQDLSHRGLGDLLTLVLERMGFSELSQVRRPGLHGAELHLSGKARGPSGDVRTAVVIRRDGREVGRERVTELRGALHHYGPALAGLIMTTGQVLSGAREEAAAPGASPVSVIDGLGLAKLCEEHEIGLLSTKLCLPHPDLDLLDALRG